MIVSERKEKNLQKDLEEAWTTNQKMSREIIEYKDRSNAFELVISEKNRMIQDLENCISQKRENEKQL